MSADLHATLEKLGPVDYADVPLDNLVEYLKSHLEAGELICNSVPDPPGGDTFESSNLSHSEPDLAASAKDISTSSARFPPAHSDHASLQDSWGKPLKVGTKDNPLNVSMWKMAGHDRHGAWFARRSVHEGISFSKFRNALRWEFLESLATEGGPGAGAVRGIGVDKRLEDMKVDGVGKLQVYQLSAQFPGPVSPRDFVTLLMTSEHALTGKSSTDGKYIPRHFMILSKPVTHTDAPDRTGYIRGHYESVEMIREVPLHKRSGKSASATSESAKGVDEKGGAAAVDVAELNPVEWIMVTRSDPGGGIPRFMVERGTPASITADVVKFFDWATKKTDIPDTDEDNAVEEALERQKSLTEHTVDVETKDSPAVVQIPGQAPEQAWYIRSAQNLLEAGLDAYAPTMVANAAHSYLHPGQKPPVSDDDDSDSSSSYESATDNYRKEAILSADSLPLSDSIASRPSSPNSTSTTRPAPGNNHDKEAAKLEQQKRKLEEKLAKRRETEASKLKLHEEGGKTSSPDLVKLREKSEQDMKKREEKHARELQKLEGRRNKELERAKRKRQKQYDRDVTQKLTRERDDFRSRVELVQRENELLRDQIGEAQRENTGLVRAITRLEGGDEALRRVREDLLYGLRKKGAGSSSSSINNNKDKSKDKGGVKEKAQKEEEREK